MSAKPEEEPILLVSAEGVTRMVRIDDHSLAYPPDYPRKTLRRYLRRKLRWWIGGRP